MLTPFQLQAGIVYNCDFPRTQDGKSEGYAAFDSAEGAGAELGEIRRHNLLADLAETGIADLINDHPKIERQNSRPRRPNIR
jgi:hypothetical protein